MRPTMEMATRLRSDTASIEQEEQSTTLSTPVITAMTSVIPSVRMVYEGMSTFAANFRYPYKGFEPIVQEAQAMLGNTESQVDKAMDKGKEIEGNQRAHNKIRSGYTENPLAMPGNKSSLLPIRRNSSPHTGPHPEYSLFFLQQSPVRRQRSSTANQSPIQPTSPSALSSKQTWEEMTPKELKALLDTAILPIREENAQLVADVTALQMKVTIDNTLLHNKIDAMQSSNTDATDAHTSAREKELHIRSQLIDDELNAISNKTWKALFEDNNVRLLSRPQLDEKKKARFKPKMLPKFTAEDDLEQWLTEVQLDIETFREELVCPVL